MRTRAVPHLGMRSYGQYCPIARASEVLAERWTPIIVRNLLNGARTFTDILDDAPGLSRSLLVSRLRDLQRVGIIEITPSPNGRGSQYAPTAAGGDLAEVMLAMGRWAERWLEVRDEHVDPGLVLHSWCRHDLAHDRLPERRIVVRFDFPDEPEKARRFWFIFDHDQSEICRTSPGFEEDLYVTAQSRAFTQWHLGHLEWAQALRSGSVQVQGPRPLAAALPVWNRRTVATLLGAGSAEE